MCRWRKYHIRIECPIALFLRKASNYQSRLELLGFLLINPLHGKYFGSWWPIPAALAGWCEHFVFNQSVDFESACICPLLIKFRLLGLPVVLWISIHILIEIVLCRRTQRTYEALNGRNPLSWWCLEFFDRCVIGIDKHIVCAISVVLCSRPSDNICFTLRVKCLSNYVTRDVLNDAHVLPRCICILLSGMLVGQMCDLCSMRVNRISIKLAYSIVCQFNTAQMSTPGPSRTGLCHDHADERQVNRRSNRARRQFYKIAYSVRAFYNRRARRRLCRKSHVL